MSSPHDALFKFVFSQPEHAAAELASVLPPPLVSALDWPSLTLLPSSFVDERLSGREADLLFTICCHKRPTLLYLLFEHQSTNDSFMPFRLLRYLVRIWEAHLLQVPDARSLPPILPVVLHHSDSGWTGQLDFAALLDVDPALLPLLAPFVPQFRFLLDDLSRTDDTALRQRALTAVGTAALVLLRDASRAPDLPERLRRWLDVLRQVATSHNGIEALSAFLQYAFRVGEVDPAKLRTLALEIGPHAEEAYMTAAQILTRESYDRGKAEGKAALVLRQLTLRFGPLPDSCLQKLDQATSAQLDTWAERLLSAASLDEVLTHH